VLAAAENDVFVFVRDECDRKKFRSLVRSVAERLICGAPATAPEISPASLDLKAISLVIGYYRHRHYRISPTPVKQAYFKAQPRFGVGVAPSSLRLSCSRVTPASCGNTNRCMIFDIIGQFFARDSIPLSPATNMAGDVR
jgi:hypothetical protein